MAASTGKRPIVVSFEKFIASLNKDERRAFNCIVENFGDGKAFSTTKVGEELGIEVDERGNGREWLSRFIQRLVSVEMNIGPFERYPEGSVKGTPHPGFVGRLAIVAEGYTKHKPYLLNVPTYVVRQALKMLGVAQELSALNAEIESLKKQEAQMRMKRKQLLERRTAAA